MLNTGLKANFAQVNVEVVDSPDLTAKPFALASQGNKQLLVKKTNN